MEQEPNTQACENCKKQIDIDKLDMHEAFCIRNCTKCPHCPDFLPKDSIDDHIQAAHKNCQFCKKMVINSEILSIHEQNCFQKGIICNLCKVPFQKEQIVDHIEHCSAKSDTCFNCFKMVLRKDRDQHEKKCVGQTFTSLPLLNRTVSNNQAYAQKKMFDTISDFEFLEILKQQIQILSQQGNISEGRAIKILEKNNWELEKSFQSLQFLVKQPIQQQQLDYCLICLESSDQQFYSLSCNHKACKNCYKQWVDAQFYYGQAMIQSPCIIQDCQEVLSMHDYQHFLDEQKYAKYLAHLQNNALQYSPYYISCPKKLCGLILQSVKSNFNIKEKLFNIMCPNCETYFCNFCKEEAHKPLQCEKYITFKNKQWNEQSEEFKQFKMSKTVYEVYAKNRKKMIQTFQNKAKNLENTQYYQEVYEYALNMTIECLIIRGWGYIILLMFEKQDQSEFELTRIQHLEKELADFKQIQVSLTQEFKIFQNTPCQQSAQKLMEFLKQVENWLQNLVLLIEKKDPAIVQEELKQQMQNMDQICIICEKKQINNDFGLCDQCYEQQKQ